MQTTTNFGLKKPNTNDFYNVDDFNYNTDIIDTALKGKLDATATAKNSEKLGNVAIGGFPRYYSYETTENGGTNGSGIDFNKLTQVGFHMMPGNFSAALNKPDGFYGDSTVIVTGNTACLTQIVVVADSICFRKNAWNGDFEEWNYGGNADTLDGHRASEFVLTDGSVAMNGTLSASGGYSRFLGTNQYTQITASEATDNTNNCRGLIVRTSLAYSNVKDSLALFDKNDGGAAIYYDVHHDGNSTKVIISTTTPTDTTVLWVDTTAMKMKIYKNNAWTALT